MVMDRPPASKEKEMRTRNYYIIWSGLSSTPNLYILRILQPTLATGVRMHCQLLFKIDVSSWWNTTHSPIYNFSTHHCIAALFINILFNCIQESQSWVLLSRGNIFSGSSFNKSQSLFVGCTYYTFVINSYWCNSRRCLIRSLQEVSLHGCVTLKSSHSAIERNHVKIPVSR